MLHILSKSWNHWQQAIFPYTCILCHQRSTRKQDLCEACFDELPILPQSCERCANTLQGADISHLSCGTCLKQPPPFDTTFALFDYARPITKLIMDLKFQGKLLNARILGELMAERLSQTKRGTLPDLILPVPLHHTRLRSRGFNQSIEIAKPIARQLRLPLEIKNVIRIKPTRPQAQLAQSERRLNVKEAFQVNRDLSGLRIAILDDVITTGQTVAALSLALRAKGAAHIEVWACAKTQQNSV